VPDAQAVPNGDPAVNSLWFFRVLLHALLTALRILSRILPQIRMIAYRDVVRIEFVSHQYNRRKAMHNPSFFARFLFG